MSNTIEQLIENPNFNRTRIWAKKRGILVKGNEETQVFKLIEEFGELCGGVLKQKEDIIIDSVGDMIVVLVNLNKVKGFDLENGLESICYYKPESSRECLKDIMKISTKLLEYKNVVTLTITYSNEIINALVYICAYHNLSINDCFNFAYNEIKNRTGKNVDGNFIKDEV
jgi:hypothetical protein